MFGYGTHTQLAGKADSCSRQGGRFVCTRNFHTRLKAGRSTCSEYRSHIHKLTHIHMYIFMYMYTFWVQTPRERGRGAVCWYTMCMHMRTGWWRAVGRRQFEMVIRVLPTSISVACWLLLPLVDGAPCDCFSGCGMCVC